MNFFDCTVTGGAECDLALEAPGLRIPIPRVPARPLAAYTGRPVTLGIRPEDIREASKGNLLGACLEAVVEVMEPLGSEVLLNMKVGPNPVVARVPPSTAIKAGEKFRLAVDLAKIHLFDHDSEQAIF